MPHSAGPFQKSMSQGRVTSSGHLSCSAPRLLLCLSVQALVHLFSQAPKNRGSGQLIQSMQRSLILLPENFSYHLIWMVLATDFILLHFVPTGRTDKLNCFRSCLYIRKDHVPLAPALHLTVPQSSCLPVRWWPSMLSPCLGLLCLQPPQPVNACLQARYLKLNRAVPEKACQCGRAPGAS